MDKTPVRTEEETSPLELEPSSLDLVEGSPKDDVECSTLDRENDEKDYYSQEQQEQQDDPSELAFITWRTRLVHILHYQLFPDDHCKLFGYQLVEGPAVVKYVKFLALTYLSFFVVYGFVRWVGWEHDAYYEVEFTWKYDTASIVTDSLFFFVVGRLYQKPGVDHLAWFCTVFSSTLFFSGFAQLPLMQHSLTLYSMMCNWPPGLWIVAVLLVLLVGGIVVAHVWVVYQQGRVGLKLLELAFCFVFFLVPNLDSAFFHFHHWFAGWWLGMHFNLDTWWSRAAMAFCWGMYVNGIGAYGRDPVLGCDAAFYYSAYQGCSFMICYWEGISQGAGDPNSNYTGLVVPHIPLDWRTCNADS